MHIVSRNKFGSVLLEVLIGLAVMVIVAAVAAPGYYRIEAQDQLATCVSNVRAIGVACEMYATDHEGCYPQKLAYLTVGSEGAYLEEIPVCPAAGLDTYSSGGYCVNADCTDFTVKCHGTYHEDTGMAADMPMYCSRHGLCVTDELAGRTLGVNSDSSAQAAVETMMRK